MKMKAIYMVWAVSPFPHGDSKIDREYKMC